MLTRRIMSVESHRPKRHEAIAFAVLTVSDTRTVETDKSGQTAQDSIEAAGHTVVQRVIVRDEPDEIRRAVLELLAGEARAVYVTGGTGISPRDRTPEAVEALLDRTLPGFGELFRQLSYAQIGAATILSRAVAGLRGGKVVFVTPGSTKAVALALEKIVLPEVGHILREAEKE